MILIAVLSSLALPRLKDASDRAAARGAIQESGSMFSLARRAAITHRTVVAVVVDSGSGTIVVRIGPTVLAERGLRVQFGVRLLASRDSMSYDPRGLGYGAANLSVVAQKGLAAETLFVSRLGRTRH